MPTELEQFKNELSAETWIFDAFAQAASHLGTFLDPTTMTSHEDAWNQEREEVIKLRLSETIMDRDGDIPAALLTYLDIPSIEQELTKSPFLIRLFCAASAIDEAAEALRSSATPFVPPKHWPRVKLHQAQTAGYLNKRKDALVLSKASTRFPVRRAGADPWWARALTSGELEELPERGTHLHRYFHNLCVVQPPVGAQLKLRRLHHLEDLSEDGWEQLRIGFVPLIHKMEILPPVAHLKPGQLQIKPGTTPNTFTVAQPPTPTTGADELGDRAEQAIRALAKDNTQIVMFPEAIVPDEVVTRIKTTLADLAKHGAQHPQLVLAGSFNRPSGGTSDAQFNEAIILNGRGQELWRQHKLHHYEMKLYEQQRYGLDVLFSGTDGIREEITITPRQITICDSPATGLRITVLICEDAAQDEPSREIVRKTRTNLILNPVMAGALLRSRGFAKTASDLAYDPGATTLVGNSGALAGTEWARGKRKPGSRPPIAIVAIPLAKSKNHSPLRVLSRRRKLGPDNEVLVFRCPMSGRA